MPGAPRHPARPSPAQLYSREGGSREAEDGDQTQAHAGLIPAVVGTLTKHIPDPLAGAVGAAGEVAWAQLPPDHGGGLGAPSPGG